MDDIHVYLPDGKRVVIAEPDDSYDRIFYTFIGRLQQRRWYGWKTLVTLGVRDVSLTELECNVDQIVCTLRKMHESDLAKIRARENANARLQAIFHGKVRDVKCPKS